MSLEVEIIWANANLQVLEQLEDVTTALTFYELACKHAPDSPMVQFKRIRCLVSLQRIDVSLRISFFMMKVNGIGRNSSARASQSSSAR
jgi:hypothetical protein